MSRFVWIVIKGLDGHALEAQRMIAAGIAGTANEGTVSQGKGRKSSVLARAVEVGSL